MHLKNNVYYDGVYKPKQSVRTLSIDDIVFEYHFELLFIVYLFPILYILNKVILDTVIGVLVVYLNFLMRFVETKLKIRYDKQQSFLQLLFVQYRCGILIYRDTCSKNCILIVPIYILAFQVYAFVKLFCRLCKLATFITKCA